MSTSSETAHIGLLAKLEPKKVLLLGDLILDMYTYGKVDRVSPEAPVPILKVEQESYLPGGAGNVALNLAGLGCEVFVCSRIGHDQAGLHLKSLLEQKSLGRIHTNTISFQKNLKTPLKNRLIASGQQLLRLDKEQLMVMDHEVHHEILENALATLSLVDIVAVSDYGKGAVDRLLLEPIFQAAKKLGLPIIVDPKSKDFSLYSGASVIKPNLKEAQEASGLDSHDLDVIAHAIMAKVTDLEYLMVTRSQEGISLYERTDKRFDFAAQDIREVVDVTGAGDCVLAAMVHGLSSKLSIHECCLLANIAGSLAVQKVGCVQLSLKDLAWQMLKSDGHNKVFDETHLFALNEACRGQSVHIMRVHKQDLNQLDFLLAVRRYHREFPQVLTVVQIVTKELDQETLDFLIDQDGIDLVVLVEESHCSNFTIPLAQVLYWCDGQWHIQQA